MPGSRPAILVHVDSRDIPLFERLTERGYRLIGFPAKNAGAMAVRGIAMEAVDFQDAAESLAVERGRRAAEAMLPNVIASMRDRGFLRFLRVSDPRRAELLRDNLALYAQHLLPRQAVAIEAFELLVQRQNVRLVLLRDEADPAQALILAARRHGIPSVHLLHGIPTSPTVGTDVHADVAAVYGEWSRDWFVSHGTPVERIAVTGNLAWDTYRDAATLTDRSAIRASLGLDPELPVVMYAGTVGSNMGAADFMYPDWTDQHYLTTMRALEKVHRKHPVQVLVKLHPADRDSGAIERHVNALREVSFHARILTGWADARHIYAADALICVDSNIGIEAMLLDRPVLTVRFGRIMERYLYGAEDGVLVVDDPGALAGAIEAALFDERTRAGLALRRVKSLYRFNYLNDRSAFDRTLNLIEGLVDPAQAVRRVAEGAPAPLVATPTAEQRRSIGEQHLHQAQRELEAGRLDAAAYLLERAEDWLGPDQLAGARFLGGYVALQQGNAAEALSAFEDAVGMEPNNAAFHNGMAGALLELGRAREAEAAVRRALAIDPANPDGLVNLAEILLTQGHARRDEARAAVERVRAVAPADPQVVELTARAYAD